MDPITFDSVLPVLVGLTAALALLWLLCWLALWALRRWIVGEAADRPWSLAESATERATRLLRRATALASLIVALLIMLYGLGIESVPRLTWAGFAGWMRETGIPLLFIFGSALVLIRAVAALTRGLPDALVSARLPYSERMDRRKRIETRGQLARWTFAAIVICIAAVMGLKNIGVDVTPLLAGGAILSVALGFGAQNLVRDIIAGIFLIVENQLRVGDIAEINGKGGQVESIRLRTTALRSLDGTVHVFQNGLIRDLSNRTMNFSYYVVDLGISYKEDVDRVMDLVREVGGELQRDTAFGSKILAPLEMLGVDDFAASAVIIKFRIMTVPAEQWSVGRELRRRIKKRFDAEGIELPFPHLSVHFGAASRPFEVVLDPSSRGRGEEEETNRNAAT